MPTYLSPHFTLAEMTATQVRGYRNIPGEKELKNLKRLCEEGLEPVRAKFGPVHINSGYRSMEVNRIIGGSKTSNHVNGLCADFIAVKATVKEVIEWIVNDSRIKYDQVIFEFGRWVHLGLAEITRVPRKEALMILEPNKYLAWNANEVPKEGQLA